MAWPLSFVRHFLLGSSVVKGPLAAISEHQLQRPEGPRKFLLAQPSQQSNAARPLVILLHGFGASAAQMLGQGFPPSPLAHWLEIAGREHWLLAAPDGIGHSWNDAFADARVNAKSDDCGFISALIDELVAKQGVDPARVYVMGVSKGGMMAFRLAAELAPKLAAFSAVLASMPLNSQCAPPQTPISALLIASSTDPLVRYGGGSFLKNRRQAGAMLGVEASALIWRQLAGLTNEAEPQQLPHRDTKDRTRTTRWLWGDMPQRVQVSLIRIDGGGHAEPSPTRRYPRWINWLTGAQSADFETAELAWEFFKDKRAGLCVAQPAD
ncbi:alpha/beta fold hydrolase [Paucibacter sp. B2R-40]|uniref:alpha/beta hydrolase family esterase n=1 Tax=Paucibacter sp. B2R-40 TaxID=2893554 RepID=UPI0021E49E62|nr:alpha/beta fold hydrolase [Paucibacter sp. B2R-40]MCV2352670.1 alpha/beta fold hydrolase [Paucibacter sp. B2R-40]